jgi:hypothetical protein
MPYLFFLFANTILAAVLRFWGGPMLLDLYVYQLEVCDSEKCVGYGAVYRISFALFLFYLPHAIGNKYNVGVALGWCWKTMCYLLLLVCAYLIPDVFYEGYVEVARVVSGFFLFLQVVILIDWAYRWNESWLADGRDWKMGVLLAAVAQYICSLSLFVMCWKLYADEGCSLQRSFIIITFIVTLLFSLASMTEAIEHGALLPSAVVTLYSYFVLYSALNSDPSDCNPQLDLNWPSEFSSALAFCIAGFSICYAAWSLAHSGTLFSTSNNSDSPELENLTSSASPSPEDFTSPAASDKDVEQASEVVTEKYQAADGEENGGDSAPALTASDRQMLFKFHMVLAAASMYLAMLLTNWGSLQEAQNGVDQGGKAYDLSLVAMWIKIVTQWVAMGLYTWSLLAPYVCTSRDFS